MEENPNLIQEIQRSLIELKDIKEILPKENDALQTFIKYKIKENMLLQYISRDDYSSQNKFYAAFYAYALIHTIYNLYTSDEDDQQNVQSILDTFKNQFKNHDKFFENPLENIEKIAEIYAKIQQNNLQTINKEESS